MARVIEQKDFIIINASYALSTVLLSCGKEGECKLLQVNNNNNDNNITIKPTSKLTVIAVEPKKRLVHNNVVMN